MIYKLFSQLAARLRWMLRSKEEIAKENEAITELVLKAMKESASGKVITAKALHEKLAKMKEELK